MNDDKVIFLTDIIKKKQEQKQQEIKNKQEQKKQEDIAYGKIEFVNKTDNENDALVSSFISELKSIIEHKENITFSVEYNIDDILNQKDNVSLATNNGILVEKKTSEEPSLEVELHRNESITNLEINAFLDKLDNEKSLENEQNIIVEKPDTPKKTSKILPFKK